MKRSKFSEEQIIAVLHEGAAGAPIREVCRKHGITEQTFYRWRGKYGGLQLSEAKRLRALEDENKRLRGSLQISRSTTRCSKTWWDESGDDHSAARGRHLAHRTVSDEYAPGT